MLAAKVRTTVLQVEALAWRFLRSHQNIPTSAQVARMSACKKEAPSLSRLLRPGQPLELWIRLLMQMPTELPVTHLQKRLKRLASWRERRLNGNANSRHRHCFSAGGSIIMCVMNAPILAGTGHNWNTICFFYGRKPHGKASNHVRPPPRAYAGVYGLSLNAGRPPTPLLSTGNRAGTSTTVDNGSPGSGVVNTAEAG